jgi:hypothetical protein
VISLVSTSGWSTKKFEWHDVKKDSHNYLSVDSIAQPMRVREIPATFGEKEP